MNNEKGKIIVIEGMDGSGKQTQAKLLYNELLNKGKKVKLISFPNYNYHTGKIIKDYLFKEIEKPKSVNQLDFIKQISSFYTIDRIVTFLKKDENDESLIDLYNEGYIIICDRYVLSNMFHMSAKINVDDIYKYNCWIQEFEYDKLKLPKPDIVLFLDVEPEVSINNIKCRYCNDSNKEDINENINHLNKVNSIKYTIMSFPGVYEIMNKIDCTKDKKMKSMEEIHEQVISIVKKKFNY